VIRRHSMFQPLHLYPAVLLLVGLVIWAPALSNGFTSMDEPLRSRIAEERRLVDVLTSPYDEGGHLYRPMTSLTHQATHHVGDGSPSTHRALNLLLHLLNGSLVFWLAWRLIGSPQAALIGSLVFSLHPIHVETVHTLAGRADLLALFFVLLAWLLYQKAVQRDSGAGIYRGAILCALLGGLSKETAILLPVLLASGDLVLSIRAGGRIGLIRFLKAFGPGYLPFASVSLLVLVLRHAATGWFLPAFTPTLVANPIAHVGLGAGFLTALEVVGRYGRLLVFPVGLSPDYGYDQIREVGSFLDVGVIVSLVGIGACLTVVRQGLSGRWPPEWGLGVVTVGILLLPATSLFFPAPLILSDRSLTMPCLGLGLLAASLYQLLANPWKGWASGAAVLLVMVLASGCMARVPDWKDDLTLFGDAATTVPRSVRVRFLYARALQQDGRPQESIREYAAALAIYPEYSDIHHELGITYQSLGNLDQARLAYAAALQADSLNVQAWINLGTLLGREQRTFDALEAFERALKILPDDVDVRYNYALASQNLGKGQQALDTYLWILDRVPDHHQAAINLGALYNSMGYEAETIAFYRRFLRQNPKAYQIAHNLGVMLEKADRPEDAIAAFEQASGDSGEMGAYSLYRAGDLYNKLGAHADARKALSQFLERWTGDARIASRAGTMLSELDR